MKKGTLMQSLAILCISIYFFSVGQPVEAAPTPCYSDTCYCFHVKDKNDIIIRTQCICFDPAGNIRLGDLSGDSCDNVNLCDVNLTGDLATCTPIGSPQKGAKSFSAKYDCCGNDGKADSYVSLKFTDNCNTITGTIYVTVVCDGYGNVSTKKLTVHGKRIS